MSNFFKAAALAVALLTAAPAVANATTFVVLGAAGGDGSISGVFGNTGIAGGGFTDVIQFELPSSGFTSATITSILANATTDVTFTSVFLNDVAFSIKETADPEYWFLKDLPTLSGTQTLTVNGISGGAGSYGGTIAFAPRGVPEPATWAMMILGFGMVGAGLRLARRPDAVKIAV
jgi:hypothetical protein